MARATETLGLRHFTVDEYHRMAAAGILGEDDRVELVRGVIRQMSPKNVPHSVTIWKIRRIFDVALSQRAATFVEIPIPFEQLDSEPEPDLVVMSDPDGETLGTEATAPLLVIEVAASSLQYDLVEKAELYAQGEIPEYWVVDLVHRVLVVFRDPKDGRYQERSTHAPGSRIAPAAWPDFELDVGALFPSEPPASS